MEACASVRVPWWSREGDTCARRACPRLGDSPLPCPHASLLTPHPDTPCATGRGSRPRPFASPGGPARAALPAGRRHGWARRSRRRPRRSAPTGCGGPPASRLSSRATEGDAYIELNLAPSTAWAAYRVRRLPAGHAARAGRRRSRHRGGGGRGRLRACRPRRPRRRGPAGRRPLARRPLRGDRGAGRGRSPTGRWPIRRASRTSTAPIALRSNFPHLSAHEIRHRSVCSKTPPCARRSRESASRCSPIPASVTADLTHSLDALAALPDLKLVGRLRAPARPARRQAGQHGGVRRLHRPGPRHPGVQPLRRGAPADRPR